MTILAFKPQPGDTIHTRLVHALTRYDRQQEQRKNYNPYALGHYMGAVERIEQAIAKGTDPRRAIVANLNGRLLDVALKACGLPKATRQEQR